MPEERSAAPVIGDRLETRLDRLEQGQQALIKDVAELKGLVSGFKMAFDQMDKRLTDLAAHVDRRFSTIQWMIGLILTLLVLVLGKLFLK